MSRNAATDERVAFQRMLLNRAEHLQRTYSDQREVIVSKMLELQKQLDTLDEEHRRAPSVIAQARQKIDELTREETLVGITVRDPEKALRKKRKRLADQIAELEKDIPPELR